jgi:hypothetical protein
MKSIGINRFYLIIISYVSIKLYLGKLTSLISTHRDQV